MTKRAFGSTRAEVSIVGQGTWQMEEGDRPSCIAALRAGLDAGMTHVDTAELYGRGLVEEVVGEAIAGRRGEVFLVSKVMPHNASLKGTLKACEASLKRLRTDHLDCYLLHWPGTHPLEETLGAFEQLRKSGKARSTGVSNFDLPLLQQAVRIAGAGKIACNQVLWNLAERHVEADLLPWCGEHGIALVGYSPFGSGGFPSPRSAGGRALEAVAHARGATPRQVALAFLTRVPHAFAIPKSSTPEHTLENSKAGSLQLTEAEISQLSTAFPLRRRAELPTA